jgi:secreted PhoX family phosphatase
MKRRALLQAAVAGAGAAAFSGSLWRAVALAAPARPGPSPYGPLGARDANGVALPAGFTSRIIARSRQLVGATGYRWHDAPDGGACFADSVGWTYVSNSEVANTGGASAVRFNANGTIRSADRVLSSTSRNCAGGATPWGTWLSCEEIDRGRVYETFPDGVKVAVRRSALGRFTHEAVACDPVRRVIYMTEDESNGRFYRFRPTTWGNLSSGTLEVLIGGSGVSGPVSWRRVPDPSGKSTRTRHQVAGSKVFNGGEGCYYASGTCWFTTKGDNRVWAYDAVRQRIDLAYDDSLVTGGAVPLTGVDNITGATTGDLYVAEDGGNLEINIITPYGSVAPFLRLTGHPSSEITGPAFSPNGRRFYFSSQRGTTNSSAAGITYEVTGPFRS